MSNQSKKRMTFGAFLDIVETILVEKKNYKRIFHLLEGKDVEDGNNDQKPEELTKSILKITQIVNDHFNTLWNDENLVRLVLHFLYSAGAFKEFGGDITEQAGKNYASIIGKIFAEKLDRKFMFMVGKLCPPTQHFFSAHKSTRDIIRGNEMIMTRVNHKAMRYSEPGYKMMHMLLDSFDDEELVVLECQQNKGFVFSVTGASDNYQLENLIQSVLVPKYLTPVDSKGVKVPEDQLQTKECCVKVLEGTVKEMKCHNLTCFYNGYNWSAMMKDGKLSDDEDLWVWKEGTPSDICKFRNKRVLLWGKPTYKRCIDSVRVFPSLQASVKLVRVLSDDDFEMYKKDILAATNDEREIAKKFIRSRTHMKDEKEPERKVYEAYSMQDVQKIMAEDKNVRLLEETLNTMKEDFENDKDAFYIISPGGLTTQFMKLSKKKKHHHQGHDHDGCGCGHDHGGPEEHQHGHHDHGDECGCGHDHGDEQQHQHQHEHGDECGCGHEHGEPEEHQHEHGDGCGCGHDHGGETSEEVKDEKEKIQVKPKDHEHGDDCGCGHDH